MQELKLMRLKLVRARVKLLMAVVQTVLLIGLAAWVLGSVLPGEGFGEWIGRQLAELQSAAQVDP